jgi:hypothetical protein
MSYRYLAVVIDVCSLTELAARELDLQTRISLYSAVSELDISVRVIMFAFCTPFVYTVYYRI